MHSRLLQTTGTYAVHVFILATGLEISYHEPHRPGLSKLCPCTSFLIYLFPHRFILSSIFSSNHSTYPCTAWQVFWLTVFSKGWMPHQTTAVTIVSVHQTNLSPHQQVFCFLPRTKHWHSSERNATWEYYFINTICILKGLDNIWALIIHMTSESDY